MGSTSLGFLFKWLKVVAENVKYLVQIGLVETKEVDRCLAPRVDYDEISLKIAV